MSYLDQIGATAAAFLMRDRRQERGVWISQNNLRLADGKLEFAVWWSQAAYWHGLNEDGCPRLRHFDGEHFWLVKQYDEWQAECGVGESAARWKFSYAGLELCACEKHMRVAERTSRQAGDTKIPVWERRKREAEETQEIATVAIAG